ncbi:MAG: GNAT family N-acetyltransferase [Acutalibacter sp.]|jgi:ribosomal protein S18 acetylase RimI-like enzyme
MIRLVQSEEEKRALLRLCEKTAFGCKISTVARAYGFDKSFACFWLDWDENVVYCLVDGVMLLSGTVLDGEASREFLHMVGAGEILCAVRNAEALNLTTLAKGDVLKRKLDPGTPPPAPPPANVREIYTLLNQMGMVGEFEPFYLDLSHKLRHQAALALTVSGKHGLCGCAVVSSISQSSAILSALAVQKEYRRHGLGTELVHRMESYFPGKTLYVFREQNKNREFYRDLGYGKTDTWVHGTL